MGENVYVIKVSKEIAITANSIDKALYKFREGFADVETEEEVLSIRLDNDFIDELASSEDYDEYESEE